MNEEMFSKCQTINCNHGEFNLPCEASELRLESNSVLFRCKYGLYQAKYRDGWTIEKIVENDD
jgi:hypothetical protein